MNKIIFLITNILFATFIANAQQINFGMKAGAHLSTLSGDVVNPEPKIGANAGVFAELKLKNFALQPELSISVQGAASNEVHHYENGNYYFRNYESNLLYLNLPVIAKYYILPKASVDFGPQLGLLLHSTTNYSETRDENVVFSNSHNYRDRIKTLDFGLDMGVSYYFTNHIAIAGRYNVGLTNIDNSRTTPSEKAHVKNHVLQACFEYRF